VRRFLARGPVAVAARLVLGGVFIYAAYDKLGDPRAFADAIDNYRLVPDGLVNTVAVTLPWIEVAVGACLLLGVLAPGAGLLAGCLLAVFTFALVSALARGLDIRCGCFGLEGGAAISWVDVAVRIALLALSIEVVMASLTIDWPTAVLERRRN
jgi:uncharacterized membrane protein YphA (DoxX/SURF4 family)